MRSKIQSPVNVKLILLCSLLLFFVFLLTWSTLSSSKSINSSPTTPQTRVSDSKTEEQEQSSPSTTTKTEESIGEACTSFPLTTTIRTKTPPSLANALVHYATSNITPQQTFKEISVTLRVLDKKSPCNFLVFGLGHDSLMWASLNHGGRTLFLEEDKAWIQQIKSKQPSLESYHVTYETQVNQADSLINATMQDEECRVVTDPRFSKCKLAHKELPSEVYDTEWDLIMVDAPTGYYDEAPGRMTAIYTAGLLARNRESGGETHVFVHDVNRGVEDKFSMAFLCQGYFTEEEGLLRHFTVPSHRTRSGRPFCPN